MPKKLVLVLNLFLVIFSASSQENSDRIVKPHVSPSLRFTENLGQWEQNILFKATLDGGSMFIEKNAITFNFYDKKKYRALHHGGIVKGIYKDFDIKCHAYQMEFLGANPLVQQDKLEQGNDYENFYLGNDKSKWKGNVKNYHRVLLKEIYNGINYEVITASNGIKYNFRVQPDANANTIQIKYKGVDDLQLRDGKLLVGLSINGVTEQKPYAYQIINGKVFQVECNYKLKGKVLSFEFPKDYNHNYELIIDPVLVFAAQSGSTADNFGATATFDAAGNLYAGGTVYGLGYPTTLGAYNVNFSGPTANLVTNTDVSITKYNPSGNALIYSTYIGGSATEVISSMIVDVSNNLCIYGATGSPNFPTTAGAYDQTFNGGVGLGFTYNGTSYNGTDIYVTKFNSSGSALLGSTYIGGSGNDGVNHVNHLSYLGNFGNGPVYEYLTDSLQYNYGDQYRGEIQVDVVNNIYVASSTRSSNFPTANAFDNTLGGKQDAVVFKFNTNLTTLLFSTYLGGSLNDCGNSLIVNTSLEVYVTGGTCSNDFPITAAAHSTVYNGGKADGFITHFNVAGNNVLHSTYVGTNNYDQSYFVQFDKYSNVFVYGQSLGSMPVVNSGTLIPYNNPGSHQFVTRYKPDLTQKTLSMVFGHYLNDIDISPCAFAVDKCNNVYLSGWGGNFLQSGNVLSGMPMFLPTQSTTDGFDFYFMGLDSNFVLKYGSYFGGFQSQEHVDGGTSRFDARGKIYQSACAGCGGHDDWPVTAGAWPNTPGNQNHSTNCNNGVVKLDFQLQISVSTINTGTLAGCVPYVATFTNVSVPANPGATYVWHLGNGVTATNVINPTTTYTAPGNYTVSLVTNDNLTCNKKDSTVTYITVFPGPPVNISANFNPCNPTVTLIGTTTGNVGSNPYIWSFGDGSPSTTLSTVTHTYLNTGTYTVTFSATDNNGCSATKSTTVNVVDFKPLVIASGSICYGTTASLTADGGNNYTWTPSIGLGNSNASLTAASPNTTTIYTVTILNNLAGGNCISTLTTQLVVRPTPTANFTYSLNPCGGGAYFKDASADNITAWSWTLSSTKTSTVQNPYYFYSTGGTYTVALLTTNTYGCKDIKNIVFSIIQPPPITLSNSVQICRGDKTQLNASGGTSYEWIPAIAITSTDTPNPVANPTISTEYSVAITTTGSVNGNACKFLLTSMVQVDLLSSSPISAYANPSIVIIGNSTTLYYVGDAGAKISWYPINLVSPSTGYTVTSSPVKSTDYTVVAQRGACAENVIVHVDVFTDGCLDKDSFVPNTFTPNDDGQNDVLYVRGLKVKEVYFAVYNRWGELVFETNDIKKGWDGRYKNKFAESGVFGWYLRAKCYTGQESFKKGNVTLVR